MIKEQEFYQGDKALFLISNEKGSEVFFEVEVIQKFNEYGRVRYLVEPIAGIGQMKVENLKPLKNGK